MRRRAGIYVALPGLVPHGIKHEENIPFHTRRAVAPLNRAAYTRDIRRFCERKKKKIFRKLFANGESRVARERERVT